MNIFARTQQIEEYLHNHGPQFMEDICRTMKLKLHVVSACLQRGRDAAFTRQPDGAWKIYEPPMAANQG